MAKKASSDATTLISLSKAKARVVEAYDGAEQLADKLLVKWLGEGKVRWSCKLFEGPSASDLRALQRKVAEAAAAGVVLLTPAPVIAYSEGDPAFWRTNPKIDWKENSAREQFVFGGVRAYGIKVALKDLLALLPEQTAAAPVTPIPTGSKSSKSLIEVEVKKRAAAGERWDSITKASVSLHEWMKTVSAKPLESRTIENRLRDWDLWHLISKK